MYVDSSVIVAVLFEEKLRNKCIKILESAEDTVSSALLEAEVLSVSLREGLTDGEVRAVLERLSLFQPDRLLTEELCLVFNNGYCKGADAYHLASALYLDPNRKELPFFTLDKVQAKLAKKLGFKTYYF